MIGVNIHATANRLRRPQATPTRSRSRARRRTREQVFCATTPPTPTGTRVPDGPAAVVVDRTAAAVPGADDVHAASEISITTDPIADHSLRLRDIAITPQSGDLSMTPTLTGHVRDPSAVEFPEHGYLEAVDGSRSPDRDNVPSCALVRKSRTAALSAPGLDVGQVRDSRQKCEGRIGDLGTHIVAHADRDRTYAPVQQQLLDELSTALALSAPSPQGFRSSARADGDVTRHVRR